MKIQAHISFNYLNFLYVTLTREACEILTTQSFDMTSFMKISGQTYQ